MVTYFNRKDLVDFGKMLLSKEREERIDVLYKNEDHSLIEERKRTITHNEVENWLDSKRKVV